MSWQGKDCQVEFQFRKCAYSSKMKESCYANAFDSRLPLTMYLQMCMRHYQSVDQVINAILEENLPPTLAQVDRSLAE